MLRENQGPTALARARAGRVVDISTDEFNITNTKTQTGK